MSLINFIIISVLYFKCLKRINITIIIFQNFIKQITKPLLERKRRARINRCLDELKDLMYTALEVS